MSYVSMESVSRNHDKSVHQPYSFDTDRADRKNALLRFALTYGNAWLRSVERGKPRRTKENQVKNKKTKKTIENYGTPRKPNSE